MQNYIDYHRVANVVLMTQKGFSGVIVLVEGIRDIEFYSKFFSEDNCRLISAKDKSTLIEAIHELEIRKATLYFGIVDSDYWGLENKIPKSQNIICTDTHDVETILIQSSAFNNAISKIIPKAKINYSNDFTKVIREALFLLSLPIGYLRWINYRYNLGLDFKDLPYRNFINYENSVCDLDELLRIVCCTARTNIPVMTIPDIKQKYKEINNLYQNPYQVCQGHDLINVFILIFPKVYSNFFLNHAKVYFQNINSPFEFAKFIREEYSFDFFMTTRMYEYIKKWGIRNNINLFRN